MKKYRCPCCGEECITFANKNFCYRLRHYLYMQMDMSGNKCPECGGLFKIYHKSGVRICVEAIIIIVSLLLAIYLTVFRSPIYAIIVLLSAILFPYLILPLMSIDLPIVKYNRANYHKETRFTVPKPNAVVNLQQSKRKINNLYIYGIRFYKKTNTVRFHEAFTNDLVPVVFHKKDKKQEGETEVTIMKKEFIPDDLLFYGSEFTVIDNGKEIASGLLVSVYEQQNSEEQESAGGLSE